MYLEEVEADRLVDYIQEFDSELGFQSFMYGLGDIDFEAIWIGSSALEIHYREAGETWKDSFKDIDVYTTLEHSDLEKLSQLTNCNNPNDGQYMYIIGGNSYFNSSGSVPLDIITDFEEAFGWETDLSSKVEEELEKEFQKPFRTYDMENVTLHLVSPPGFKLTKHPVEEFEDQLEAMERAKV